MRRLWLALWLAVLGWDALAPHLSQPAIGLAAVALAAAALLFLAPAGGGGPWFGRTLAAAVVLAALVAARALPWPENLGALVLAAGCLAAALPRLGAAVRGMIWRALAGLGGLLLLFAALSPLYGYLEAGHHDFEPMARPIAFLYRAIGLRAAAEPPFVHWQGVGALHSFDCSLEKCFGHALSMFIVAGLAMLFVLHGRSIGWKRPVAFLGAGLGFAFVRLLALGLVLDDGRGVAIFFQRAWIFGGLLALVAVLAVLLPPLPERRRSAAAAAPAPFAHLRRPLAAAALAATAAAALLAAGALGYFDPGRPKAGRILMDERHSNWEWSTIQFNTESYGVQTVYNYSELVRLLGHYYDVAPNMAPLTDSTLARADVLILKTPTRPYDDAEVEAVVRFVERGGGLWLIGDHTNIFGMDSNLNKVARRFGIRFHYDAVIDLMTNGRQLYERPRLFAHPSLRHLPTFLWATSCSLSGPLLGQRVTVGRSLLSDELDYSTNTFFGNFQPDPDESFGSMLQSVAVTRGKGRVLSFTDSTVFSNFFMFIRGKPELALGSVVWLMHENRWAWVRGLLLAGTLLAAALLATFSARLPRGTALAALALVGLPLFAVAARGLDAWVSRWSEFPAPRTPLPEIAFERGRTAYEVPDLAEQPENSPSSFQTFYVLTQRVGYMPSTRRFQRCLERAQIAVFINPWDHFRPEEQAALAAYVRNGGSLLVLDTPHAQHRTANQLLEPFGMRFTYAETESVTVRDAVSGDSLLVMRHVGRVEGGEPLLLLPDGGVALAQLRVGEGRVVAMCASDDFSDARLGTTSEIPNPDQLALYRLEFRIFDQLLRPEPRGAPSP